MLRVVQDTIHLARCLQPRFARIARRDAALEKQLRRAVTGVTLNLAEGSGALGGNKRRAYSVALGEARELEAGLCRAEALAYAALTPEEQSLLAKVVNTTAKLARR